MSPNVLRKLLDACASAPQPRTRKPKLVVSNPTRPQAA